MCLNMTSYIISYSNESMDVHLTSFLHYSVGKSSFNKRWCVLFDQNPCNCPNNNNDNNINKLYLCSTFNAQIQLKVLYKKQLKNKIKIKTIKRFLIKLSVDKNTLKFEMK